MNTNKVSKDLAIHRIKQAKEDLGANKSLCDLHIHTNHSDGRLKVGEILQKVKEQRINTISFCDHNTLGAYKELEDMDLRQYNVKIITGIEFDFVYKQRDFHMLGYNFNWKQMNESDLINKKTDKEIIQEEQKKLEFLKSVCKDEGIKFDENLKIETANDKASTVLKYHMMKFEENNEILDKMLGKNREKSFARGFVGNPKSKFFIDETIGLPTCIEVADLIHNCSGLVFLAHPYDYKDLNSEKYINEIYDLQILDGIECMHTRHTKEQVEYIKEFCKEKDLKISGGSDFHREGKQRMGYGVQGTVEISDMYCLKNV